MTNRVPLGMVVMFNMRGTCAGLRATSVEVSGHVPRPFFASFLREVASHQPGEARGHEASQVRSAQDGSHVPPADVENGPGAEAGGGQIQHRLRHFLWFAQPSKRLCWLPGTSVPKTGRENSFCHTTTTNDSRQAYASFLNSWQFYGVRGSQTFHFSFSTSCSKEDYCSKVMGSEAARK